MKYLAFALFLFILKPVTAQDALDEISDKVCSEVGNIPDTLSKNEYYLALGLKMLEIAQPYEKVLKKKHNIDLSKQGGSEALGEVIGMRMAVRCPNELKSMLERVQYDVAAEVDEIIAEKEITGEITKVEDGHFVVFSVKDNYEGKTTKFYWLSEVDTELDLAANYSNLVSKNVLIEYATKEFFDPRIGDYRLFKVINSIKELD